MLPDFDSMNETDVREIIVRPLLIRLGYQHGTQANIRTEVPLRYSNAFLGRKNPKKDPPLAGRADYICDAISYGRWAVEVKAPNEPLSQDAVEQAHTYCAHPDISALYFLLTNGREFRLYQTSRLTSSLLSWTHDETDSNFMTLFNIVSYEAIRRLSKLLKPDIRKPLGEGISSKIKIVSGTVHYGSHKSDHPLLQIDGMNGKKAPVVGVGVSRADDGRLHGVLRVVSPMPHFDKLNKLLGFGDFNFYSSDEFVSVDVANPTIFQNVVDATLQPGMGFELMPGTPEIIIPFGFHAVVFTEATGYFDGDRFLGSVSFRYDYEFIETDQPLNPPVQEALRNSPKTAIIEGEALFDILVTPDID